MARGLDGRFVMANGRGAEIDPIDRLAREKFIVVADVQGKAKGARILAAAAVDEADIRTLLHDQIKTTLNVWFDIGSGSIKAERRDMLGALVLARRPEQMPAGQAVEQALIEAVQAHGLELLPWREASLALRARMAFAHAHWPQDCPDCSDQALLATLDDWLLPYLAGLRSFSALAPETLADALLNRMTPEQARRFNRQLPASFAVPTGSQIRLRYENDDAVLAVRVQELYGLKTHPAIMDGAFPLLLELLSPAQRPIQTTRDLPAFWAGSWREVRAEMRGRYPRHVWPDDPANSAPTQRAKPRGT
jgi:ATP-dependent helicase HrpB